MHHPLRMEVAQRGEHGEEGRDGSLHALRRQRPGDPLAQSVPEVRAAQVLHGEERLLAGDRDVVDLQDAAVVQLGQQEELLPQDLQRFGGQVRGLEALQRQLAVQELVTNAEDLGECPFAQPRQDAVAPCQAYGARPSHAATSRCTNPRNGEPCENHTIRLTPRVATTTIPRPGSLREGEQRGPQTLAVRAGGKGAGALRRGAAIAVRDRLRPLRPAAYRHLLRGGAHHLDPPCGRGAAARPSHRAVRVFRRHGRPAQGAAEPQR